MLKSFYRRLRKCSSNLSTLQPFWIRVKIYLAQSRGNREPGNLLRRRIEHSCVSERRFFESADGASCGKARHRGSPSPSGLRGESEFTRRSGRRRLSPTPPAKGRCRGGCESPERRVHSYVRPKAPRARERKPARRPARTGLRAADETIFALVKNVPLARPSATSLDSFAVKQSPNPSLRGTKISTAHTTRALSRKNQL